MHSLATHETLFDPHLHARHARVGIIGCGALGSMVAAQLARIGFSRFDLIDPDHVESRNVSNQIAYTDADLGVLKVDALRKHLLAINPAASIATYPFYIESLLEEWSNPENVGSLSVEPVGEDHRRDGKTVPPRILIVAVDSMSVRAKVRDFLVAQMFVDGRPRDARPLVILNQYNYGLDSDDLPSLFPEDGRRRADVGARVPIDFDGLLQAAGLRLLIDGRMSATTGMAYAMSTPSVEWERYLSGGFYSDDDVPTETGVCGNTLSIIPTVSVVASLMVNGLLTSILHNWAVNSSDTIIGRLFSNSKYGEDLSPGCAEYNRLCLPAQSKLERLGGFYSLVTVDLSKGRLQRFRWG